MLNALSKMSICLNMIVKNESGIIKSTLENLTKYVKFSYWVICDTGSTDGTQDIILDFFKQKNIDGEIHQDEWKNFGHNRTLALERAYKKTDYVLVFDADDSFNGDFQLPKLQKTTTQSTTCIDKFSCKFGYGNDFTWYRPVILNNNLKWKYVGVLHEYVECYEKDYVPFWANIEGDYYIEARTIGGDRNKDDKKYYKDAILLEDALHKEEDSSLKARYTFYCAQSFRDFGDLPNAIRYYKMRTTQGSFDEEIHVSYHNAGKLMILLNEEKKELVYSEDEIVSVLFDGWKFMKDRVECLYEIAKYFRTKGNFEKGYLYSKIGIYIPFPKHRVLFLRKDVYEWRMKDEHAIHSYYLGFHNEAIRINQKILRKYSNPRILDNMKFSINHVLKNIDGNLDYNKISSLYRKERFSRLNGITLVYHLNREKTSSLFKLGINSLVTNMKDIYKIERFIILCPETRRKDAEEMSVPFFEIISYKHPTHILNNVKSKLNRHDRFIFYMCEGWLSFVKKNYFDKSLSLLSSNKKYGQFIFNKTESGNLDDYMKNVTGVLVCDPSSTSNERKYFEIENKTPSKSPCIFRRDFWDSIESFEKHSDENFSSVYQNQIDFCIAQIN